MLRYMKLLWLLRDLPELLRQAEVLFPGKGRGAEKKHFVLNFAYQAMVTAEAVTGREIVDETMARNGLSWLIDGIHALLTAFGVWKIEEGIGAGGGGQ